MEANYFSPSQIEMFRRCGEQYRRRYVLGEKKPPGVAACKGSACHKCQELSCRQQIRTGQALAPRECREIAADTFRELVRRGCLFTRAEETRGSRLVVAEQTDRAAALGEAYGELVAPDYRPVLVERRFRIRLPGPALVGVIDLVDEREPGRYRVVDLKTATRKKSQADADASLQLTAYAAGCRVLCRAEPAELRLDVLVERASKKVDRQVLVTRRNAADFETLAAWMNQLADALRHQVFRPAPPGSWYCSVDWCGYADTCKYFLSPELKELYWPPGTIYRRFGRRRKAAKAGR